MMLGPVQSSKPHLVGRRFMGITKVQKSSHQSCHCEDQEIDTQPELPAARLSLKGSLLSHPPYLSSALSGESGPKTPASGVPASSL